MPRTKKPQKLKINKVQNTLEEEDNNEIKFFNNLTKHEAEKKKSMIQKRFEQELIFQENTIKQMKLLLSPDLLNQPYETFFEKDSQETSNIHNSTHLIIDDKKENKSIPEKDKTFVKQPTKRTRKLMETPNQAMSSISTAHNPLFLTPAITTNGKICPITPKVDPNEVITMLRHPRHGEVGISINGSPLLVTSNQNHDLANVNIPLRDGNVISLIGQPGEVNVKRVCIDKKTTEQLKIIKRNLDIILEDKE